jgi:Ca2+-binding RTX toxin-like protein
VDNINDAPASISLDHSTIAENAAAGAIVGTLTGSDPDQGDTLAFSLVDNPDNIFVIMDDKIELAEGRSLDFESRATYDITVRATDSAGETLDQVFTIDVTDIDEAIRGTQKNNTLVGTAGDDVMLGLGGDDTLDGRGGADELNGGNGSDTASYASAREKLVADLAHSVKNSGDAMGDSYIGIENLVGSKFADKLSGNGRANEIDGGKGNDTLLGGADRDVFVFGAKYGKDTIADFDAKGPDHDSIDLSGAVGISHFKDLIQDHLKDTGDDLIITAADGSKLVLEDISAIKDLVKADFLF